MTPGRCIDGDAVGPVKTEPAHPSVAGLRPAGVVRKGEQKSSEGGERPLVKEVVNQEEQWHAANRAIFRDASSQAWMLVERVCRPNSFTRN